MWVVGFCGKVFEAPTGVSPCEFDGGAGVRPPHPYGDAIPPHGGGGRIPLRVIPFAGRVEVERPKTSNAANR